jgi:hypothetical protein
MTGKLLVMIMLLSDMRHERYLGEMESPRACEMVAAFLNAGEMLTSEKTGRPVAFEFRCQKATIPQ